jgi:hypothetical protein
MSDRLDDAFTALREETGGASDDAPATRRAVLLRSAVLRRRRSLVIRYVVPLAAVLVVSSAWAAATGRLPRFISSVITQEHREPPVRVTPPPVPVPTPEKPVETPVPTEAPVVHPAPTVSVAPLPLDREDTLYRTAHGAHFVSHDYASALAAWDAYLAAFPRGRFAPEARYNRGIALVRLGRNDEARAALRPFADGAFGGYRQAEARELLDALE